jgi:hypothetical protein
MVADHYARLGFIKAADAADKSTEWRLPLDAFRGTELPFQVESVGFLRQVLLEPVSARAQG